MYRLGERQNKSLTYVHFAVLIIYLIVKVSYLSDPSVTNLIKKLVYFPNQYMPYAINKLNRKKSQSMWRKYYSFVALFKQIKEHMH